MPWSSMISSLQNVKRLAVDNSGGVYLIDGSFGSAPFGHLSHYNNDGQLEASSGTPPTAQDVAVGSDGSVWYIDSYGSLMNLVAPRSGSVPNFTPITGTHVAVANNGYPIVVETDGTVAMWNGSSWNNLNGKASEVAASAEGSIFIVGANTPSVGRYNFGSNSFEFYHMDAAHVAVDPGGHPWAIRNGTNVLYKGALDQTY